MNESNFAEGYNVFTGAVSPNHPNNSKYGEVHTGDAWEPARSRYCQPDDNGKPPMPVALIVFGDKSHTDLHGSLALTPVISRFSFFPLIIFYVCHGFKNNDILFELVRCCHKWFIAWSSRGSVTANIEYLYIRNYGTDNDCIFEYTIFSRTLYSNLRGFLVILCRFVVIL